MLPRSLAGGHHAGMLRASVALVPFLLLAANVTAQTVEWWQKDFDGALAAAKDKPAAIVLLYCWRDNHDGCSAMFSGTLSDKALVPPLADFVCMGVKDDAAGKPVQDRFGISQVPTILFVDPAGKVVDVVAGYVPVAEFTAELKRIRAGTDTIQKLRERADAAPDDLALRLNLVRKLRSAGDKNGSVAEIDAIVAKDPKCASEAGAEAMLLKITDQIFRPEIVPADYDLKPLREFLGKQKQKRMLFLGYDRMAAAEYRRQGWKAAGEAVKNAWKNVPPEMVIDYGQSIAGKAYENWVVLDKLDKNLLKGALDISKRALDEVEKKQKTSPDKPFYANALYLHASMLVVNNLRKEAFAMMDRAMTIDPKNENLKKARDRWLDGSK